MAWPNGPEDTDVTSEPVETTRWKVYNYYKKSCEEHELWTKDGMTIRHKTGFRWGGFYVDTNDSKPPEFEFTYVPGGDGNKDSIDMYNCYGNNIESSELEGMTDGCWDDIDWPEEMDAEEQERLQELIEEHGIFEALEDMEGWMLDESEAWLWGPIAIENDNGDIVRIIEADDEGNVAIKEPKDYE